MTKAERTCPRCGLVFASEKLDGLCPSCLLANTLDLEDRDAEHAFWEDEVPTTPLGRAFSHFDIVEELGRGGMGTVYRARDHVTGRTIALKVLQAHHLDEPDLVKRFRAEVRAVTSLDHPNILPIHEVGEHDGIPFFSMKLATGGSLAQRLPDYLRNPRQSAQLVAKIARGIQHAHEHGILHRDLKPGNILLDDSGEPYVCDFGLAKWIDDDRRFTVTSAVLGTPHYIAPEQALGKKGLTIAADIYSLGAILYELLTGRPPFVGESVIDTLRQASESTPAKPSSIVNNTPRDLEIICLKALEREPQARYKTALALAQDLENWVAGRPIHARPVTAAEQLWRWARRNPLPAALGAFLALAITALAVGSTIAAVNIDRSRQRAVQAEKDATEQLYNALLAQARASRMTSLAGHRIEALEAIQKAAAIRPSLELRNEAIAALTLVDLKVAKTLKVRESSSQRIAFDSALKTVAVATESGDINILSLDDGRLLRTISGAGHPILALIHSGTRYLVARCSNDAVYLYEYATGRRIAQYLNRKIPRQISYRATDCGFSPDETLLTLGSATGIEIYEIISGKLIATTNATHPEQAAISPDGKYLAFDIPAEPKPSKEKAFCLWSFTDKDTILKIPLPSDPSCFAWSPDMKWLAVGCSDYTIQILRTTDWHVVGLLQGHRQDVSKISFNRDANMLVSFAWDRTIRLWDLRTMSQLVEFPGCTNESSINFTPDDRRIATSMNSVATIVEVIGFDRVCIAYSPPSTAKEEIQPTSSVDFSPNSKLLAKASTNSVQIFDAKKGRLLETILLPQRTQTNLRFLPDNGILAVASRQTGVTLYRFAGDSAHFTLTGRESAGYWQTYIFGSASFSQTPFYCLTSDRESKAVVSDLTTGDALCTIEQRTSFLDLSISPDQKWLATTYRGRNAEIWSFPSGKKVAELPFGRNGLITFSPSGKWIGLTGQAPYLLWNVRTWDRGPSLPPHIDERGRTLTFSHDEKYLAVDLSDETALVSLPDGNAIATLEQQLLPALPSNLRFSPDSTQLAVHRLDNSLVLWELTKLKKELRMLNLDW